ncbi:MAG: glycerate kinase family protein [Acidimicrobiales bacterium]
MTTVGRSLACGPVLACPDKFKGTASAPEVAAAIAAGARRHGVASVERPLSDGGEGLLDIAGGANRSTQVTGPLGRPVLAEWRLEDGEAVIEMAGAAGLTLAGGATGNDPVGASTAGVGELVLVAVDAGATRIVVGCGGSATTDGGSGAVEVIGSPARLGDTKLLVACDVEVGYLQAARLFGPQKGATPRQARLLGDRLQALAERYRAEFGRDVSRLAGSGAAGGLAGGLAALGAELVPGIELVAEMTGLDRLLAGAAAVVTGEGRLDAGSFAGKVVGSVARRSAGRPVACVCGRSDATGRRMAAARGVTVLDLSARYGSERAMAETPALVETAVSTWLETL